MPIATFVFSLLLILSIQAGKDTPLTPKRLADLIEQQRVKADPLLVKFRIEFQPDQTLQTALKEDRTPIWSERMVAFEGRRQHCTSHTLTTKGQTEQETRMTAVFTGDRSLIRQGTVLRIQNQKSPDCSMNEYTSGLMWPVTDQELQIASEQGARSSFLLAMLRKGDWLINDRLEEEAGVACQTITSRDGNRKIWLDPTQNYALIRVRLIDPFPGFSLIDTRYGETEKVAEGMYLPRKIVSVCTLTDLQGHKLGQRTDILTVSEIKVGDLPTGLFELEPQAGDTVIDQISNKVSLIESDR